MKLDLKNQFVEELDNIYKTDTLFRKYKGKNSLSQNIRMTMFELG